MKSSVQGRTTVSLYKDMLDVNIFDTANIVRKSALEAISAFCTEETCPALTKAVENLTRVDCVNVKDARRQNCRQTD